MRPQLDRPRYYLMGGLLIIFGGLIVLAGCARVGRDGLYFKGVGMAITVVGLTLLVH